MGNTRMRRVYKIIILLLVVFVLALVASFVWLNYWLSSGTELSLTEISRRYELEFPPSAKLVHSYLTHSIGPEGQRLIAKIEMDKADVHHWIADLQKTGMCELSSTDRRLARIPTVDLDWWKPEQPRQFVAINIYDIQILVNLDTGKRVIVYLYHST